VVMSEPKPTDPLNLPAENITQGDISLGLMQTPSRSRLSRMPHGLHINDEKKKRTCKLFSWRQQSSNWERSLHPRHAQGPTALERQPRLTQLTQHATRESKTNSFCFMQKFTWPSHNCSGGRITPKSTPKSMRMMPLCLWGV
jgi:hypothetical protein